MRHLKISVVVLAVASAGAFTTTGCNKQQEDTAVPDSYGQPSETAEAPPIEEVADEPAEAPAEAPAAEAAAPAADAPAGDAPAADAAAPAAE